MFKDEHIGQRPYQLHDARDIGPCGFPEVFAAIYEALITLLDKKDATTTVETHSHDSTNGRVHSLSVSTAAQHCNRLARELAFSHVLTLHTGESYGGSAVEPIQRKEKQTLGAPVDQKWVTKLNQWCAIASRLEHRRPRREDS